MLDHFYRRKNNIHYLQHTHMLPLKDPFDIEPYNVTNDHSTLQDSMEITSPPHLGTVYRRDNFVQILVVELLNNIVCIAKILG